MASQSKQIHDRVVAVLSALPELKEVTSGFVPTVSNVKKFPSIAIDFAVTRRKEGKFPTTMDCEEEIDIYLYNQQKSNQFEDILSDLCDKIDLSLQRDTELLALCASCFVMEIVSDGGILHPQGGRAMARLTLYVKYTDKLCDN